jgi:hypothetical protein
MLQRVHIQIVDDPMQRVMLNAEGFEEPATNMLITEELRTEMHYFYPHLVSVEYIDLFLEDTADFLDIRSLIDEGAVQAPVVLINGVPKIHGGIPRSEIKDEVDKLLYSGPLH